MLSQLTQIKVWPRKLLTYLERRCFHPKSFWIHFFLHLLIPLWENYGKPIRSWKPCHFLFHLPTCSISKFPPKFLSKLTNFPSSTFYPPSSTCRWMWIKMLSILKNLTLGVTGHELFEPNELESLNSSLSTQTNCLLIISIMPKFKDSTVVIGQEDLPIHHFKLLLTIITFFCCSTTAETSCCHESRHDLHNELLVLDVKFPRKM